MVKPDDVKGVFITLRVEEKQSLFILLFADGSVNRLGTGRLDNEENDLFIAKSNPEMFLQLSQLIDEEALQWEGGYKSPDPIGQICKLTVGFMNAEGKEQVCVFEYGADSIGPPPAICKLVTEAIKITDPWYQAQKSRTNQGGKQNG